MLPCRVSERGFFGFRPARPSAAIRRATVFSDTRQPSSRRSPVIRGEPYVPPEASKCRAISSSSRARRSSRAVGARFFHL
jgi:hypothetical protein